MTKQALKDYILSMLGSDWVDIELSDYQLDQNIKMAVDKFSEYAMYGRHSDALLIEIPAGTREIILDPLIAEVLTLRTQASGGGFMGLAVPGGLAMTPSEIQASIFNGDGKTSPLTNVMTVLSNISAYDVLFTLIPNYDFNPYTHVLKFLEPIYTTKVLLEVEYKYVPKDDDDIYDQIWVKEYAMNLCKRNWGSNIGKYNAPLINGATLNYERILSEANEEIRRLEEDLVLHWSPPLPMIRG